MRNLFAIMKLAMFLIVVAFLLGAQSNGDPAVVTCGGFGALILFNLALLKEKTTMSTSGGGYTSFRFAPKDFFEVIPKPDPDNPHLTTNDFIFKEGKDWIYIYTNDGEFDYNETPVEVRNNNGYNSELKGLAPGENEGLRYLINSGIANIDGYALLDNCKDNNTILFGKGKCCAATLKINFKGGKAVGDAKGFEFTLKIEQEGVNTYYSGVGAINDTYQVNPDDTSPDVSKGTATYLLGANTVATAITTLDNAVVGSLVTFKWTSTTNASTFTHGTTFWLNGAITPEVGTYITFQVITAGKFAERYRHVEA